MTGKTMMPDNFDEYFEKWLARKITQKEIANELKVSQSVVSNWIIQFRKDTGKDRDYIKTDAFKDALKGYEDKELSTRQAGRMLGITHTGFRKLVMKAQEQQKDSEEQKQQKGSAEKEDAPKEQADRYGIDQMKEEIESAYEANKGNATKDKSMEMEDFLKPSGTCELEYEGLFLPKKEYGIDQLMADLSDETPETGEDGPGGR